MHAALAEVLFEAVDMTNARGCVLKQVFTRDHGSRGMTWSGDDGRTNCNCDEVIGQRIYSAVT